MTPSSDAPRPAPINPFFSPAQLYALSIAPSAEVLGEVTVSGKQKEKYVQGDYITLLLNHYVGPGMWDKRIEFIAEQSEILTKRRKRKENGRETGEWEDYEILQVSATVKTTLIIYARDGSDRTKQFEAITVGTGLTDPKNGKADALDNAIKSAETDGLKRTSKCLGRAFGLDLKTKIAPQMMPPSLAKIEADMAAYFAKQRAANSNQAADPKASVAPVDANASSTAATSPVAANAVAPQVRTAQESGAPANQAVIAPAEQPQVQRSPAQAQPQRAAPQPALRQEPQMRADQGDTNPGNHASPAQTAPQGVAATAQTSHNDSQQADMPEWDLTMQPKTYIQWVYCLGTMSKRLGRMTLPQEIENFRKRHERIIANLPNLQADGDHPGRNFKNDWNAMVEQRYQAIGHPCPAIAA